MNGRKIPYILTITLLISLSLISGCWGSQEFKIIFENNTEQTVTVYIDDIKVGSATHGDKISHDHVSWDHYRYLVEAIDSNGVVIYSKTLTRENMEKIETKVYKVNITSSENATDTLHSDNFSFKE